MKKNIVLIMVGLLFCAGLCAQNKFIIVIDPGHGGKDAGAVRGKIKEKDINLGVALMLGKLIEDNWKDAKIVYTRKTDAFVDLNKRTEIANKAKANLFISIHTNSTEAKTTTVAGADTYIMGLARSEENLRVAQRENSVILLEDDYKKKYENFDPKSPESYIIFEFMTNKYMDQSLELASHIQTHFKTLAKRTDRGVKQAGFLVLRKSAMPSILIELGFINNPNEAKYLSSATGQRAMASAIFTGLKKYKNEFDKKQGMETFVDSSDKPSSKTKQDINTEAKKETKEVSQTEAAGFVSKPKKEPVIVEKKDINQLVIKNNEEQAEKKEEPIKTMPEKTDRKKETSNRQPFNMVEYRVQILMSMKQLDVKSPIFKGLSPIDFYKDGDAYKYTYGSTTNRDEAVNLQRKARKVFGDAFIIELLNGKRVK